MERRRALPAIAALLLFAAPWVTWWTYALPIDAQLDATLSFTLYDVTARGPNVTIAAGAVPGVAGVLGMLALIVLALAGVAAAALALRLVGDGDPTTPARLLRIGSIASLAAIVVVLLDAILQGGTPSWGGGLAAAGAVLGLVASTQTRLGDDRAVATIEVAPARAIRGAPAGGPVRSLADLRFVVRAGHLVDGGLQVELATGAVRTIAWTDVTGVIVRRLPPDPPFEKAAFLDLVTADGPVRLLGTSRIDFAALPRGAAPNSKENWRRLIDVARAAHGALAIDADSASFFAGGEAPMFPAIKKFVEYDQRYA